jgi:hypothetical protein
MSNFSVPYPFSAGAGVGEMTKAGGAAKEEEVEEELSSFTPKSPLNMPYIPDELNDPAAYPATHAAFKEAQAKYREKLSKLTPTLNPLLTPS